MTRDTKLPEDLAAWAEEERRRLGEGPTSEQLVALRDGRLSETEADTLRERLAVDPELAAAYLELERLGGADPAVVAAFGEMPDSAVDEALHALRPRLEDPQVVEDPAYEAEVLAFPRRDWRRVVGVAASLVFVVGVLWMQAAKKPVGTIAEDPHEPSGSVYPILVTDRDFRDPSLPIPEGVEVLEFQIETSKYAPGSLRVELRDVADRVVAEDRIILQAGQREAKFAVSVDLLDPGRVYQIFVLPTAEPDIAMRFRPVFQSAPNTPAIVDDVGKTPCQGIGEVVDQALDSRRRGDRIGAERRYLEALDAAQQARCGFQEARAWNGLAVLSVFEEHLAESLDLFDRAESILRKERLDASRRLEELDSLAATIEHNRAGVRLRLGRFDEALDAITRTRFLYERSGAEAEDLASTLLMTARIQRFLNQPAAARSAAREGLDVLGEALPRVRSALLQIQAQIDLDAGRHAAAEAALDKAMALLEDDAGKLARANLMADRAELELARQRWAQSLRWSGEALDLASSAETLDVNLETHARYLQSVALWKQGNRDEARLAAEKGLARLEATRNAWSDLAMQYFAQRANYFRHRLDLAATEQDAESTWSIFEGYRAQGLLDGLGLRTRRKVSVDRSSTEIDARRQDLLAAIRDLDVVDLGDRAARARREERFGESRLALQRAQAIERQLAGHESAAEIAPEEALGLLGPQDLALIFASGNENLHLMTLDAARGLEQQTLAAEPERINELVRQLLRALSPLAADQSRSFNSTLRELSDALLKPLANHFANASRLVIVADEPLQKLPFELLFHPATEEPLIESHEIVYLPSFSVLSAVRQRVKSCESPRSELLAVGDPIFGHHDPRWPAGVDDPRNADQSLAFGRLTATRSEVESVAELYDGATTLLGAAAIRQSFLDELQYHNVIHVASHARSEMAVPERSKIALSCVDSADRPRETCDVFFADIVDTALCGQIVVLSACDTAGGTVLAGEGILGLPWAFLRAGAATVVASLWQVEDQSTAELMGSFHQRLQHGASPAAALRGAKLELAANGSPESVWAAFIAIGDG